MADRLKFPEEVKVVGVCGGGSFKDECPESVAREIGVALADIGDIRIVCGACPGYPGALVDEYLHNTTAIVSGISPFTTVEKHMAAGFPVFEGMQIDYFGEGGMRNPEIIRESTHAIIFFPGGHGTNTEIENGTLRGVSLLVHESMYQKVRSRIIEDEGGETPKAKKFLDLLYPWGNARDAISLIQVTTPPTPRDW